jgi:asparagine synthase (glutamine-hydrolysing)
MCGIAGIVNLGDDASDRSHSMGTRCRQMRSMLVHRGPDDQGEWIDPSGIAVLAQTRLAIIDLSPAGHQPMVSRDNRFVIAFNGEIYNFETLRDDLIRSGVEFRGHSDTEVLLELFAREGASCLARVSGMFAFAVWDRVERSLFLARDPLGIKPLYCWQVGNTIAFASEIRAVLESNLGPRHLDSEALFGYFQKGAVPEPLTLVEGVRMLPAGHYQVINRTASNLQSYWSLQFTDEISDPLEAKQSTSRVLEEAMQRHFVSDVPVGIFLSGGLDSTALVALAHRIGRKDIQTLSIGFEEAPYDESMVARQTAEHFGCNHHEKRMHAKDASGLLEDFARSIDQPSVDGFNTFIVSRFAKECGVKVVLSGLGGDELFGGYPSFRVVPKLLAWHRRTARAGVKSLMIPASNLLPRNTPVSRTLRFLSGRGEVSDAFRTVRSVFSQQDSEDLVRWYTQKEIEQSWAVGRTSYHPPEHVGNAVSQSEISSYMLDQLLRDSDVMSMRHSLELRVPLLDRAFVEHVTKITPAIRLANNKQLLVDSVPEIPPWVRNRRKQGFTFPFAEWMSKFAEHSFCELKKTPPIPLPKWYHQWTLFSLNSFLSTNQIQHAAT